MKRCYVYSKFLVFEIAAMMVVTSYMVLYNIWKVEFGTAVQNVPRT